MSTGNFFRRGGFIVHIKGKVLITAGQGLPYARQEADDGDGYGIIACTSVGDYDDHSLLLV